MDPTQDPTQDPNQNPSTGQTEQSSALANEPEPTPTASTQIPVSEIPSEVKSLEELSGAKESANEIIQETSSLPPEMQPTSAPAEIHTTDDSKAKIVKIVVPIVVAIALGLGGFLVYSFFIKGDAEEAVPAEEPTGDETPGMGATAEESTIEEQELEQALNEEAQKAAEEASEGAPTELNEETTPEEEAPAEESAPAEETPKVKVPRS